MAASGEFWWPPVGSFNGRLRGDPDGRRQRRRIVVHAMHPGWADTPGIERSLPRFHRVMRPLLRTPAEGADTIVWLASAQQPGLSSGGFWHDRRMRSTHRVPWTRETEADRRALWQACMRATGPNRPQTEAILSEPSEGAA